MDETYVAPEWPAIPLPYGVLTDTRLATNGLVRSSVFSTMEYSGAHRPEIAEPLPLAAIAPYRIEQVAGVRLSQSDADLFFWLLTRAYRGSAPKGKAAVFFKRAEAFVALGRSRGGKTDALLAESLQRLRSAEFIYEVPGLSARIRLLADVLRTEDSDRPYDYQVVVADSVARLLEGGEWLTLSGKIRAKLANNPLAMGLYAFYASHKTAFPMLPATLKALMGRESMQDSKWRKALEKALSEVQAATGWHQCELVKYGPLAGKIAVQKGIAGRRRARTVSVKAPGTIAGSDEEVQNDDAT